MNKATIGAILFALSCWAYPISTAAQAYAQISPQAIPEIHDPSTAQNANPDTSERSNEDEARAKETEQVKHANESVHLVKPISTSIPSIPSGRNNTAPQTNGFRHYSKEEVQDLIRSYSAQYGISADLPLRIANCESGYNQFSKNRNSTASGVFQYLASTWKATDQGKMGLSVFDAEANVKAAVSYIASRGHANPWNASRSCWSKS